MDAEHPIRQVRMSPVKNLGLFPTTKSSASQPYESLLERDFMTLQEFDCRVARFAAQPITIRWKLPSGEERVYTPDLVVHYHDWCSQADATLIPTLFEVKPRERLKHDWAELKPRFKAAIAWTRMMGYRFRIATENEIQTPYLENVQFLLRFQAGMPNTPEALEQQHALKDMLSRIGTSTPQELLKSLTSSLEQQAALIPWLWYLVNTRAITVDLSVPLTMNSPIGLFDIAGGTQ